MKQALSVVIRGIKCDAPGCGYNSDEEIADYGAWLNRPCPDCGASLITPEDLAAMDFMRATAAYVSALHGPVPEDSEPVAVRLKLDGSGFIGVAED